MTQLDRLLSAERLVAAHAFAGAPIEALVNLFPQEAESVAVQEVLRALQAMPADVTPSLASLIAAGASADHVQFILDWQDEAFNVSFDRAEEALLCARTLTTASKVLSAALDDARQATLTRDKSAAALTQTADALASLVAGLESTALDSPSMKDYFESYVERQRVIADRGAASWGVRWMDQNAGQFTPGTMTMLAGLPGHGKSVFGVSAARATASLGKRVLFVCLEMEGEEVAMRLASLSNDLYSYELQAAIMNPREGELERIADTMPADFEYRSCGLREAESVVRRAAAAKKPFELVVFDYIQMFEFGDPRESEANRLKEAAYFIKRRIAMQYGCAALVLAQFSKAETGMMMPNLRNVRGASALHDACDVGICILTDAEPSEQQMNGVLSKAVEVSVQKFRNGAAASTPMEPFDERLRMVGGKFMLQDPELSIREEI